MSEIKAQAEATNRGGRPRKEVRGGLTKVVGFRLRPTLRSQLEAAAHHESRSISEECERRLDRSFDREAVALEFFGAPEQKPLILALCNAVRMAGSWADDEATRLDECYAAVISVVEGLSGKKVEQIQAEAAAPDRTAHRNAAYRSIAILSGIPLPTSLSEIMGR